MRTAIASLGVLLSVLSGFAAEEKGGRVAEAEIVAQRYMTAFYHSDLQTAVSLTHPETLEQFRKLFAQERAAAVTAGKEAEFLAQFGITNSTALDALGSADFYVTLLTKQRQTVPADLIAAMKSTVVTIKGSQRTEGERVTVALVITLPAHSAVPTQDARLSLAFVDNQWKVIGNAP